MSARIETGDFIALLKGASTVRGQCMGWKIDSNGDVEKVYIDGFDLSFWISPGDWQLIQEEN
jgi:hypothetical protein